MKPREDKHAITATITVDIDPIPMMLYCPECNTRHIDEGVFETKRHHTHSCQECGHTWRPAIVPTVGVRYLPGFKNALDNVLEQVHAERQRQDDRWGGASHDDEHEPSDWLNFVDEHRNRAAKHVRRGHCPELADADSFRHELVVIAALAVAAIESLDRTRGS